jgi:putative membrane protein
VLTVAHVVPATWSQLWGAWSRNPLIWVSLAGAALAYHRGCTGIGRRSRQTDRSRHILFGLGLLSVAIALVSPLDALSSALASAHMVQHLMLTVVAAPLLAASAPVTFLLRGLPAPVRRSVRGVRRSPLARSVSRLGRNAVVMAAVHTVVVWFWHIGSAYDAAVDSEVLHAIEHATLLATALASWAAILNIAGTIRTASGSGVLVLFGLSMQSAILGALLTFAPRPWYRSYTQTTATWGLTPLADQQLAGVIMWVPAGVVYLVAALHMLASWTNTHAALQPGIRLNAVTKTQTARPRQSPS